MSRRSEIQDLIRKHQRRLQKLREKEATLGINTPPETLTEIEDIEAKTDKLLIELQDVQEDQRDSSETPAPAEGDKGTYRFGKYRTWAYLGVAAVLVLFFTLYLIGQSGEQGAFPFKSDSVPNIEYDTFDDSANEGNIDQVRWIPFETAGQVYQQDKKLVVSRAAGSNDTNGMTARAYRQFVLDSLMIFEAKMMVSVPQDGHAFFSLRSDLPVVEYTNCSLGYSNSDKSKARFACRYSLGDGSIYSTGLGFVDFGVWHRFRIEVDPSTMHFTYFLNDQRIGSYIPENVNELQNASFTFDLGVNGSPDEELMGYFDDVRIGKKSQ